MPSIVNAIENLQTTWERVRADVFSHAFAFVVLALIGVRLPPFAPPAIDPAAVVDDPWFQLAKETNAFLLAPLVVAALILLYAIILRSVGSFLVNVQVIIWTPRIDEGNLITPLAMVPRDVVIALAARSSTAELTARDLEIQLYKLVQTYVSGSRLEITGLLDAGQGALNTARTYWANLSFLLVAWILSFTILPADQPWRVLNGPYVWNGIVALVIGVLWARLRFVNALPWVQASYFGAVGQLALADERLMDAIPTDVSARAALEERVEEVIEEVRRGRSVDDAPSLVRFARVLLTGEVPDDDDLDRPSRDSRWPMLDEGRAFRHRHRELEANGGAWLRGWAKYRLWRLVETASRIVRTVVVWVKLTLFGAA